MARNRVSKRLGDQCLCATPRKRGYPCRDGHPEMWTFCLWPWGWARQRAVYFASRFPETRGPESCFDQGACNDFWELSLRK